jgi:phosphoribosylformimino-5-aminoimidazole carboxamide ribotide isomerase
LVIGETPGFQSPNQQFTQSGKYKMAPFTVFPSIDLRAGKIVRLTQGDPKRQTTYGHDPRARARQFKAEGAEWLHVVNLSGAFGEDGRANLKALEKILAVGLKVEFGGGLRSRDDIRIPLEMGVRRIFLGTAAIQDPALVDWALVRYGAECVAADIGVRDGQVRVCGWQEAAPLSMLEAGRRFRRQGLEWCVLTDVRRDGVGAGVNVEAALKLQNVAGLRVVASGGVSSVEDVCRVHEAGLAGVIVGRALYRGDLRFSDLVTV